MNAVRAIGLVSLLTASAQACEMYETKQFEESVMFHSPSGVCFSLLEGIEYTANKFDDFLDIVDFDDDQGYDTYWDDWVLKSETNPILTRALSSNYVGVGVWVPTELENRLHAMDTEEWILSHGLLLSVGFGKKSAGEPRMRLDYRWHDKYDGDVMMQIELPF
ncbi:hypothetical protein ACUALS_15570 [Vibrio sp. NH-7]